MKSLLLICFVINFAFSMEMIVIPATDNLAFNYFFSFPVWVTILSIPMVLALSILKLVK